MKLLTEIVSDGYSFHVVFSWWGIATFILLVVVVIYVIKRRRK